MCDSLPNDGCTRSDLLWYCASEENVHSSPQVDKSNALHERACIIISHNVRRTIRSPESTNKTKALTIVRKCIEGSICDNFRNYFEIMNHNRNTRNQGIALSLPRLKLSILLILAFYPINYFYNYTCFFNLLTFITIFHLCYLFHL